MIRAFRILVNPSSGGGRAAERVRPVAALLRKAGADVQVVLSLGTDHSRSEVAVAAASGQTVVACGGDGMLASVAGELVARAAPLGIVPCGRGNDFARQLGLLDATPEATARTLLHGRPTPVDAIAAGDRVVLGSVYAGVDSLASQIVDRARWLPGPVQYPYAAVRALLRHRPGRYRVVVDGVAHAVEAFSVVVANSGYYGKGMHVAPDAAVDDGLLDVVVIPSGSRLRLIRLLPEVYSGRHVERPEVLTLRGRSVRLTADRPVVAYGDGERLGPLPMVAEVARAAIQVLLPRDRP